MRPHRRVVFAAHRNAGAERLQSKRVDVHRARQLRIGGVEHREAAVATESVDEVGAQPAPDVVAGLPHRNVAAGGRQYTRTAQARQSGADHEDVDVVRHVDVDLAGEPAEMFEVVTKQ